MQEQGNYPLAALLGYQSGGFIFSHCFKRFLPSASHGKKVQGKDDCGRTVRAAFFIRAYAKKGQLLHWGFDLFSIDSFFVHKNLGDFRGGAVLPYKREHSGISEFD